MSFAAAFYSLTVELSNSDAGTFSKFRVKTPLHPYESLLHLCGRFLAYVHCYRAGQEFTQGLFDAKQPTIWQKDVTGEVLLWAQVGALERKKLEQSLRANGQAEHRVYFLEEEQAVAFANSLRGSKTNWIEKVRFYRIDPAITAELADRTTTSSVWSVTCVDSHLYLICDGKELETTIEDVDIWEHFQAAIGNVS